MGDPYLGHHPLCKFDTKFEFQIKANINSHYLYLAPINQSLSSFPLQCVNEFVSRISNGDPIWNKVNLAA